MSVKIGNVEIGGPKFTVIAGPCSIESEDQFRLTTATVKKFGAALVRGGIWKMRTSPKSFQGLGNSKQMRLRSDWQIQLDQNMPKERHALFTCWYSNADNIVFPASTATLPGADNRLLRGVAHVQMAFMPQVMAQTLAMLNDNPN